MVSTERRPIAASSSQDDHECAVDEPCSHYFAVDGGESAWLLNRRAQQVPRTEHAQPPTTDSLAVRAHKVQVVGKDRDDIYRPEVMKTIEEEIDRLDPGLREVSLKIHGQLIHDVYSGFISHIRMIGHGELGFKE